MTIRATVEDCMLESIDDVYCEASRCHNTPDSETDRRFKIKDTIIIENNSNGFLHYHEACYNVSEADVLLDKISSLETEVIKLKIKNADLMNANDAQAYSIKTLERLTAVKYTQVFDLPDITDAEWTMGINAGKSYIISERKPYDGLPRLSDIADRDGYVVDKND